MQVLSAPDHIHMTGSDPEHDRIQAGVIGVGSMGHHHARVYAELLETRLVGISDVDSERATAIAGAYGTSAFEQQSLLDAVDVVSVAVPTRHHVQIVRDCIEHGVDVLVEKPYVDDIHAGRELADFARERGVTVQVGHIERFNPVTDVLADIVADLDVIAIDIDRLGPPLDRFTEDNVVMDLMIHDIDILLSLVDAELDRLSAVAHDDRHVTAQFQFENNCVATLTGSRLTQEKVRSLWITALSCRVKVDFISQSVEIHRRSLPSYIETNGGIRYRHESIVERPMVQTGEPLKAEIEAFIEAVRSGSRPRVSADDALNVLEVVKRVEKAAFLHDREVITS